MSFCNMLRPNTPGRVRGCRTPKRDRPGHQNAEQPDLPVEFVLQDASHFPALPKELPGLPRGRKDRRGCGAWEDLQGGDVPRASSRSLSRSGRARACTFDNDDTFDNGEDAQQHARLGRARACSFDTAADPTERSEKDKLKPTTPRSSSLKKPRPSTGESEVESGALAKLQEEMHQKMKEMMALMGKSEASDVQTLMAAQLTKMLDSATTEPAHETEQIAGCTEDNTNEVAMRPRRISNPRPMEAPLGSSWEYPLSKEEKKARVVMISSAEIDCLTEENGCLIKEVARLSIDPQD